MATNDTVSFASPLIVERIPLGRLQNGRPKLQPNLAGHWSRNSHHDSDGISPFGNCDIDKYPDYGIVTYSNKAVPFTNSNERRILEASLAQCREAYAVGYVRGELVTQDYRLTHREQWVSPQLVSFHPRWIVVLFLDYSKPDNVSQKGGTPKSDRQRSIAAEAAFKVGFVVEGARLFDQSISVAEVARTAKRFDHPVHVDYSKSSSSEWEDYTIIERFEDSMRGLNASELPPQ